MKKVIVSFLAGLVIGAAAGIVLPRWAEPHLPPALRAEQSVTEGTVVAKQRRDNQLLLTVDTAEGAVLATFHQKLDEISLLIDEGDTVGLGLRHYEPFAEDPPIRKVVKPRPAAQAEAEPAAAKPGEPESASPGVVEAGGVPADEDRAGADPEGAPTAEKDPVEEAAPDSGGPPAAGT